MRIAIIGAGLGGLCCAHECERLGVKPDLFERDDSVGWNWPFLTVDIGAFSRSVGNPLTYAREKLGMSVRPNGELRKIIMKSPNQKIEIEGDLGYTFIRGKSQYSLENQLLLLLKQTALHFNHHADFEKLSKEYDYVIVASAKENEAVKLGVWEDKGQISMISNVVFGDFNTQEHSIFFNTEYAGGGYGRLSPFSSTKALIDLFVIGHGPFEMEERFSKFLKIEGLGHYDYLQKCILPVFQSGRVSKFQVGNVMLVGRAAGLTERFIGLGGMAAAATGVYAARAAIQGLDYDKLVKPVKAHIENISAFRSAIDGFTNDDFDRLLAILGTPGIKQLLYNSTLNVADIIGTITKRIFPDKIMQN